jgi:hypothetical protein
MTTMMKVCVRGVAVLLLVVLAPAAAELPPSAQVSEAVEFPLPSIADVIGAEPAAAPVALVAIADANGSDDGCADKGLGFAIGTTLRVRSFGLSPMVSFTQPMSYWDDARKGEEVASLDRVHRVVKRVGATYFLRSNATADGEAIRLHMELIDAKSGATLATSERVSSSPEAALAEMLPEVLAPLAFSIADAEAPRMDEWRAASPQAFAALREAFTNNCGGASYGSEIEKAWRAQPDAPVLAALYVNEAQNLYADAAVADKLALIPTAAMRHPVVDMMSALTRVHATAQQRDDDALTRLKQIASRYAQEPGAWDALADALASGPAVTTATSSSDCGGCQPVPNQPEYAQAITITLADARRWHGNYRAWWGLARSLDRYADAVRGGNGWSGMSEQAARRYPKLLEIAGDAARHALESHSGQGSLYAIRMDVEATSGEDWYSTFIQGAEAAPNAWILYNDAMNFAADKWGGDARMRGRIYRLAVQNNPHASWPAQLYRSYAPGSESFFAIYGRYLWIALFLAALAGVVIWLRRRSTA